MARLFTCLLFGLAFLVIGFTVYLISVVIEKDHVEMVKRAANDRDILKLKNEIIRVQTLVDNAHNDDALRHIWRAREYVVRAEEP